MSGQVATKHKIRFREPGWTGLAGINESYQEGLLKEAAQQLGVKLRVEVVDEDTIDIDNGALSITLFDADEKITFFGERYTERAYELTEAVYFPGNRDNPPETDVKEIGVFNSPDLVVAEALANHVRQEAMIFILAKAEDLMLREMTEEEDSLSPGL